MTGILKRKLFVPLVVAAAVVLAGVLAVSQFGSSARAQAASPSRPAQQARCSLATLNGTYVFSENGVQVTGGNRGPFAIAGLDVFDGRGHARGVASESLNGRSASRVSFTATYTLNPDCTGTYTATGAAGAVAHADLYGLPSGNQFTFLQTDPGVVVSGVETRR